MDERLRFVARLPECGKMAPVYPFRLARRFAVGTAPGTRMGSPSAVSDCPDSGTSGSPARPLAPPAADPPCRATDRPAEVPARERPPRSTYGLSVLMPIFGSSCCSAVVAACTEAATCQNLDRSGPPR
jgi:hypothetical protein